MNYFNSSLYELKKEFNELVKRYKQYKAMGLSLNMARGKPGPHVLRSDLQP